MFKAKNWRQVTLACVAAVGTGTSATVDQAQAAESTESFRVAQAQPSSIEKQAFDSAKELGSVEAWDAFLTAYPSGFYSDLARAYVKKLAAPGDAPTAPVTQQTPTLLRPSIGMLALAPPAKSVADMPTAAKRPCSEQSALRSQSSDTAARITFINYGQDPIEVYWLDDKGQPQLFGEIKKDRQAAVETFLTHPWLVTDLAANCLAIALPSPGPQVFVVGSETRSAEPVTAPKAYTKPKAKKAAERSCSAGQIRVDGRCIYKKQAVSFCGPGFKVRNGKCVSRYEEKASSGSNKQRCPKGQVWSAQELCHYDD